METNPMPEAPIAESNPASLRVIYLERLERLLDLRRQHEQELNQQGLRLLDHSVFAAYCDCRDVGGEEEAQAILRQPRPRAELPATQLHLADPKPGPEPAVSPQPSGRRARPQG